MPACVSTQNKTRSALRTASAIWNSMSLVSDDRSAPTSSYRAPSAVYTPYPPVSVNSTVLIGPAPSGESRSTSTETRSRVTPGVGSTIATLRRAIMFTSELLPTFGRPTMAILGTGMVGW